MNERHCFLPRIRAKFAPSSQLCASHTNVLIHEFLAKFARISHEYLHFIHFPFHLLLSRHGTAGCPTPERPWPPKSDSAQPGTPVLLHSRARARARARAATCLSTPSSSAGAPPADIRPAVPAAPPPAPDPDPVVVANPVAGTGATAYPSDLPRITTLSMLRTQPPFAWKLDLPGRKWAREEFVATTWEIGVGMRIELGSRPSKFPSPAPSPTPTPGEVGRRGRGLLPFTHTGCVEGIGGLIVACTVGRGCRWGS